jgi:monoamine oxidase
MGTGVLSKVFLRFPSIFWDNVDWIEHVASVPRRGQFHQWLNCARVTDGTPVLLGFLGGFYGHDEEANLTDAQIVADAMAALREMYGPNIPEPIGWQIPRWSTDPCTGGSYSFNKLGSTPSMRADLAAHINKRVFFAGEATHKDFFATVHGAYLSGLAAAAAIQAA